MIVGALAIFHDDPTRTAEKILHQAVENARDYCAQAVETDGTWAETPDYWWELRCAWMKSGMIS